MSAWISTPHVAIQLLVSEKEFIPFIYPYDRPIMACANRNNVHAFKCALRQLDKLDAQARRELRSVIQPLPEPDTENSYAGLPDEVFEIYEGE